MVSSIHKDTTMTPEVVFDLVERKVRFAHVIEQHYIQSHQSYSDSEKKSSWYSKEEKKKQQSKHYKTTERMASGQKCKKGTSYRGLEGWTRDGGKQATEQIHACIDAVMDEQVFQWRKNSNDAELIDQTSRSKTKKCVKQAIKRAKHDEKEAKKAVNSMEEKEMLHDSASFSTTSTIFSSASPLESRRRNQWNEARTPMRRTSTSRRSSIYLSPQKQSALEAGLIRIQSLSLE
jgi:hypothetical protein